MSDTHSFPTATVLSALTGKGTGATFGDVHVVAEFVLGHPIWTHEFAAKSVWDSIRQRIIAQHPAMADLEMPDGSDEESAMAWVRSVIHDLGDSITLTRGDAVRTKDPFETLREIAGDKPVVVVSA